MIRRISQTADKLRKSFDGADSLSEKSDLLAGNFDQAQNGILPLSLYNQCPVDFSEFAVLGYEFIEKSVKDCKNFFEELSYK